MEIGRSGPIAHIGKTLISQEAIQARVRELANQISSDYEGRNPILISLLKGGFVFVADLVRHMTIPHDIDFIRISSYRDGCSRSDTIEVLDELHSEVTGRDVIIVEGIVDTGHTVSILEQILAERRVASMRVCTLLDKPSCREIAISVDYVGFTVPDCFVVGYGLDFRERFRNLSFIAELIPLQNRDAIGEVAPEPRPKGGGVAVEEAGAPLAVPVSPGKDAKGSRKSPAD